MYSFHLDQIVIDTPASLQVVYPSHDDTDKQLAIGFERLIEGYNRRLPPSHLLFVCPSGLEGRIRALFDERDDLSKRLRSTSQVVVAPFDQNGKVLEESVLQIKRKKDWPVTDDFVKAVANHALGQAVDDTNTILRAPHGYVFSKPSTREKQLFVRAENMLREPAILSIFNQLILRKMPPECEIAYIDSFTILSFALSLKSIMHYFAQFDQSVIRPAIENFRSYEVSQKFRVPNEANYVILISASTSGELARKLVDENQAEWGRVIHLLGVGKDDGRFRQSCVYFRAYESTGDERRAEGSA